MSDTLVFPLNADVVLPGPPQGAWTHADWEALPDDGNRYEIIEGVVYMTTAPSNFHQWIIQQLIELVGIPVKRLGHALWFVGPSGVLLPRGSATQPDFGLILKVNAGIIHHRRIRGVPDLLVEVLSPGNPEYDQETKRLAYADEGVPEYVVIDPATRTLYHYRLLVPGSYAEPVVYDEGATVTFDCVPAIPLKVGLLFADAPDTEL
jgi:Uma2 family endonuclease